MRPVFTPKNESCPECGTSLCRTFIQLASSLKNWQMPGGGIIVTIDKIEKMGILEPVSGIHSSQPSLLPDGEPIMVRTDADQAQQTRILLRQLLSHSETSSDVDFSGNSCDKSSITATTSFLAGQRAFFCGRLSEADKCFHAAWEAARSSAQCYSLRWKSCLSLARLHHARQQLELGRQYEHLGRSAFFSSGNASIQNEPPGEILLSIWREKCVLHSDARRDRAQPVQEFHRLRESAQSDDFQGQVEEMLAEYDSPDRCRQWFRQSLNNYLRAGNAYSALLVSERLAACSLREGDWILGQEVIGQASQLADWMGRECDRKRYGNLASRLERALEFLQQSRQEGSESRLRAHRRNDLWN